MNLWSLDLLEYESLRALLRREVHSPMGRERLDALVPHTDRAELEASLADAEEAIRYVRYGEAPIRFTNLPDPTITLQKLRIEGAILDAPEIYALTNLLAARATCAVPSWTPPVPIRDWPCMRPPSVISRGPWLSSPARSYPMARSLTKRARPWRGCVVTACVSRSPSRIR